MEHTRSSCNVLLREFESSRAGAVQSENANGASGSSTRGYDGSSTGGSMST